MTALTTLLLRVDPETDVGLHEARRRAPDLRTAIRDARSASQAPVRGESDRHQIGATAGRRRASITLDGMIARILSDLATAGVPVGWHSL